MSEKNEDENSTQSNAPSQSVRILVTFVNDKGESTVELGRGFILRGEYCVTCYHLLVPKDSYKLVNVKMVYNEREKDGKHVYDEMILKKDFEPNKEQYDFSKHVYTLGDYKTDVIVLKLPEKMPEEKHTFSKIPPKILDQFVSIGNKPIGNVVHQITQTSSYVLTYYQVGEQTPEFFGTLLTSTHGSSGGPLFNMHGEILGMVQFSMEDCPSAAALGIVSRNNISSYGIQLITDHYIQGEKLQFSIDINYLIEHYLRGYL